METERYILDEKGVLTFKDDVTMIKKLIGEDSISDSYKEEVQQYFDAHTLA